MLNGQGHAFDQTYYFTMFCNAFLMVILQSNCQSYSSKPDKKLTIRFYVNKASAICLFSLVQYTKLNINKQFLMFVLSSLGLHLKVWC